MREECRQACGATQQMCAGSCKVEKFLLAFKSKRLREYQASCEFPNRNSCGLFYYLLRSSVISINVQKFCSAYPITADTLRGSCASS